MDHISTDYGVDSSSRFPFRTQTNRETELKALATPATDRLAWVNKQKDSKHAVKSDSAAVLRSNAASLPVHESRRPVHLKFHSVTRALMCKQCTRFMSLSVCFYVRRSSNKTGCRHQSADNKTVAVVLFHLLICQKHRSSAWLAALVSDPMLVYILCGMDQ